MAVVRRVGLILWAWLYGLVGARAEAADWRLPAEWPTNRPRVLLIGDSNVYGPIGAAVQAHLVRSGYAVWRRGKPGSGLSLPNHYDWAVEAAGMIAQTKPAVVILQIGGNDVLATRPHGWASPRIYFTDQAAWRPAYLQRVRDVLHVLVGEGRRVFLLSPTNRGVNADKVRRVAEVQREAALAFPSVTFVDMFPLTTDPEGRFLFSVNGPNGERVIVRRPDLIHFNDAGGLLVGARILAVLGQHGLALR
jgi:hypothetical protein